MDIGTYDEVPKPKSKELFCVLMYQPCENRVGRNCTNRMDFNDCIKHEDADKFVNSDI